MKRSGKRHRVKVSANGKGVVSHAGAALLRELATETGLADGVTGALLDTYRGSRCTCRARCLRTWRWRSLMARTR